MDIRNKVLVCALAVAISAFADNTKEETTDSVKQGNDQTLEELTVVSRKKGMRNLAGAVNGVHIGKEELFKAACCNLGESFTTNPSVDVNYNDAATGARQIKLLGLSGKYVQMLTENLPNFRGAASPFALGYVPGPWMQSIQVSKGASSVKNGYESITGQINVEYLKADAPEGVSVNAYGDSKKRIEGNFDANLHITDVTATELLAHYENSWEHHDGNGDGFQDKPNVRQVNLQNRWIYKGEHYMLRTGVGLLDEMRTTGQVAHGSHAGMEMKDPYTIAIGTRRYDGYMKNAFIIDKEHGTNIALMATASMQLMDSRYGHKFYNVNEKNVYAQLMFEHNFNTRHNLAAGLSFNHDYLGQHYFLDEATTTDNLLNEKENVGGAYAQYTYNLDDKLIAMAGVRIDRSNIYGTFVTPRFHLKWQPSDIVGFRMSAGKGYRTVHAMAENHNLLGSSRRLVIGDGTEDYLLDQEEAWNYGISAQLNIPIGRKTLKVNGEYYYTDFVHQVMTDLDTDPHAIRICNLDGSSYSHVWQIDASYPVLKGLELTAAYRRNMVKETYGGVKMDKALQSKYKGLFAASYKTPLGLWQVDLTLQMNGGGRMPNPYTLADGTPSWDSTFPAFAQLSGQITRWFRHWSIYLGGENLTGYKQKTPIIGASDPWGDNFDTTMIWGPVHGAMAYLGVRVNIGR